MVFLIPLIPFNTTTQTQALQVRAGFRRKGDTAEITFRFDGDLSSVNWSDISSAPTMEATGSRVHDLWKNTCLEAFFSLDQKETSPYWEMNCATSGDWNVYKLASYRAELKEVEKAQVKIARKTVGDKSREYLINISGLNVKQAKFCGLTCVMKFMNGETAYWSLAHKGEKPDFHDKHSFTVKVD